jgi:hypothetical protein
MAGPSSEWTKYRVGPQSNSGRWSPNCLPLTQIFHVAHIPTALRIVEDGCLRADLISDESKLKRRRIRVVWLSPNDWWGAGGSRYGNVRFSLDWESLILGKSVYWVETMKYRTPACRILLTDKDHDPILEPYDPATSGGPWRHDKSDDTHHWNGDVCLELMYEGDIPLQAVSRVDFVKHHKDYCCIDLSRCAYKGFSDGKASGEFIARLIATQQSISLPGFTCTRKKVLWPEDLLDSATEELCQTAERLRPTFQGTVDDTSRLAIPLVRAVAQAIVRDPSGSDAMELATQFKTEKALLRAVVRTVADVFNIDDPTRFKWWPT